jgi:hypothetical protein
MVKMRLFTSVLASAAIFLAASMSSALSFDVLSASAASGNPLTALVTGDVVTINVRMSNSAAVQIFGIGGGAQFWDQGVASFVSGQMNAGPYSCTSTLCTAGLNNALSFPQDEETGVFSAGAGDVQNVQGVGNYIPIVQAISTTGRAGTGARDPGLDGVVNGGDAQFRLVFQIVGGPGSSTAINIGTNDNPILGNVVVLAGGATESAQNANIVLAVVPAPGPALLRGLGRAGLAAAGRRE